MSGKINASTAILFSNYQTNVNKIQKTVEQLSLGHHLTRPGDSVIDFERTVVLDFEKSSEMAQMEAMQNRLAWYDISTNFLEQIREVLTTMSEDSMQALSGTSTVEDLAIIDEVFQGHKARLSEIIDGESGTTLPRGVYGTVPMFLGYSPGTAVGPEDIPDDPGIKSMNLYTGNAVPGFRDLTFLTQSDLDASTTPSVDITLTGTAGGGSTTSITLAEDASDIFDIYEGLTITITGGTGSGETAKIASYNGTTRVATFTTAVGTALDNTSVYSIDSGKKNYTIEEIGGVTTTTFAEHIWGADNYRLDHLSESIDRFIPLTPEEETFRTANGIADSDPKPRTNEEKLLRRRLNIFDPEFGNLKSKENAKRMLEQVQRAIDQISIQITREDAKGQTLRNQYELYRNLGDDKELGIENARGLDFAEASSELSQLSISHDAIFNIALKIHENFTKLTSLAAG